MLNKKSADVLLTKIAILIIVVAVFSGCSYFGWGKKETGRVTPESIYQGGVEFYQNGKYEKAVEKFQRLKEEYPLSKYALMAELGIADSYFSDEKYAEAEGSYTDFLNLHPTNVNLPYAIYQLGMCHYHQMMSIDRDQSETIKARKEFEKLTSLYPSSQFAFMAEKMLRECRKRLGEHEFYIGQFYYKKKQFRAALKRFENVAREYPNIGLDYKISYFILESKRMIEITDYKEKEKKEQEQKEKGKQLKS